MISWQNIERYCAAIAREFHPEKIIVFGSYAYGAPSPDSDVDLMVILPRVRARGIRDSLEIRQRVSAGFPVDVLVRTSADIARRLASGESFVTEVVTKGRVVYEARHA